MMAICSRWNCAIFLSPTSEMPFSKFFEAF